MKSSYNPREEIDDLRRMVDELMATVESNDSAMKSATQQIDTLGKMVADLSRRVQRLEMTVRMSEKSALDNTLRTVGGSAPSVSDIIRKNKR